MTVPAICLNAVDENFLRASLNVDAAMGSLKAREIPCAFAVSNNSQRTEEYDSKFFANTQYDIKIEVLSTRSLSWIAALIVYQFVCK